MKKILILALVVSAMAVFTGCRSNCCSDSCWRNPFRRQQQSCYVPAACPVVDECCGSCGAAPASGCSSCGAPVVTSSEPAAL